MQIAIAFVVKQVHDLWNQLLDCIVKRRQLMGQTVYKSDPATGARKNALRICCLISLDEHGRSTNLTFLICFRILSLSSSKVAQFM